MKPEKIMELVWEERLRQDKKWGRNFAGRHPGIWNAILGEEIGEVSKATLDTEFGGEGNLKEELIQSAAVIFAWLELGEFDEHSQNAG